VGPRAVIRADEQKSSITTKDNCNVQDGVIIHALKNSTVVVNNNSSLAHGCIIHGPCKIAKNCFVGFNSVVYKTELGRGVFVKHLAVVEGVKIPPKKLIESSKLINSRQGSKNLPHITEEFRIFSKNVVKTNLSLIKGYKRS